MANSTPQDRLYEIYTAYSAALDRRPNDLKEAKSKRDVDRILANVDRLHASYFKAARTALEANGAAVEAAYKAAKQAREAVDQAYKNAKSLAEKIGLVGDVAAKVGKLLTKASGL